MSETKQVEKTEFETLMESFKPAEQIEDNVLLRMKFPQKRINKVICRKTILFDDEGFARFRYRATFRETTPKTVETFEVTAQELGWSKTCDVLVVSKENTLDYKSRKMVDGYWLFMPTVKCDAKNVWLFWQKGKLWCVDFSVRNTVTNLVSLDDVRKNSKWDKAYAKRILLTREQLRQLIEQHKIAFLLSEGMEGSMLF